MYDVKAHFRAASRIDDTPPVEDDTRGPDVWKGAAATPSDAGQPLPPLDIAPDRFFDDELAERVADRDPSLRPPLLVDTHVHVFWREGGYGKLGETAEQWLKIHESARSAVVGTPIHDSDMGRVSLMDDLFLNSDTDIAFINSFGMSADVDGVDLFPPREAAFVRSLAPGRFRVLGTVDPPDGQSAVESLLYQCEAVGIDGLKLYPPGIEKRGWRLDDEKVSYPLFEVLRKKGIKRVCMHVGMPGIAFIDEHTHPVAFTRAAHDFPDLEFVAYHAGFPYEAELAEQVERLELTNVWADMGLLCIGMCKNPERFAMCLGTLLKALGPDRILWGTDTPIWGPPQWQIDTFRTFKFPDELIERHGFPALTQEVKEKIFCHNAVRLFDIDIVKARAEVEADLFYRLRKDGGRHRTHVTRQHIRDIVHPVSNRWR